MNIINKLFLMLIIFNTTVFSGVSDITYLTDMTLVQKVIKLVKEEYVKEDIDDKRIIYGAIKGILKELNDPYSRFLDKEHLKSLKEETNGQFGGIGIVITVKNKKLTIISPIEGTPAYYAGIKPGDIILKIDNKFVDNITNSEAMDMLRGKVGTKIKLIVFSEATKKEKEIIIKRDIIKLSSISESGIIGKKIGYIRISNFSENTSQDLKKEVKWMKEKDIYGLILDLRGNPGGLLIAAVESADIFLDKGIIVSLKSKDGKETIYSAINNSLFKKPIVILINKGSASASEILAGALKDNKRCLIVGERSFGKGIVQSVINLDDGSAIALTTSYYYTPSGKCIHNIGIKPDIFVKIPLVKNISKNDLNLEQEKIKLNEEENIVKRNKGEHALINISKYDDQLQRAYDIIKATSILNKTK